MVKIWTSDSDKPQTYTNAPASPLPPVTIERLQKRIVELDTAYPQLAAAQRQRQHIEEAQQFAADFKRQYPRISINQVPGFSLIGHAASVDRAYEKIRETKPDFDCAYQFTRYLPKWYVLVAYDGIVITRFCMKPQYQAGGGRGAKKRRKRRM